MPTKSILSTFLSLACGVGLAAAPAHAETYELSAPSAWLGLTPVLAEGVSAPRPPVVRDLSYDTALTLTEGMPWVVMAIGGAGLAALSASGNTRAADIAAVPILGLGLGAYSAGYVYAGEPQRGAMVALGDVGILGAGILSTVLIFGSGQSSGFGWALVTGPITALAFIGYQVWTAFDLHDVVERKNEQLHRARP